MDAAGRNSGSLRLLGHIRGSWRPDLVGAILAGHLLLLLARCEEGRRGAKRGEEGRNVRDQELSWKDSI